MSIGNTLFKKRFIHKSSWVSGDRVQRALMDYLLIDRCTNERLLDVNLLSAAEGGMFDHFLVEARVKVSGRFRKRGKNTCTMW